MLNVTATDRRGRTRFLTVHPAPGERPVASDLNFRVDQTVANLVVARVGRPGR